MFTHALHEPSEHPISQVISFPQLTVTVFTLKHTSGTGSSVASVAPGPSVAAEPSSVVAAVSSSDNQIKYTCQNNEIYEMIDYLFNESREDDR